MPVKMKKRDLLKIFESHGVEFSGKSGQQVYGYDPFSGKQNKFYVNTTNGLWDSKSTGLSGNVYKFLELRAKDYEKELKKAQLRDLAENRQLPTASFREWGIGWDGKSYTFPIRDFNGRTVDIRRYAVKSKLMMSTAGVSLGLMGADRLKDSTEPIYLCEGEWDTIALHWLLHETNQPGIVVGVPGAATFKTEWVPWFQNRLVHTLYDADQAGREGELRIAERLKGVAKRITYVHWPDEVPVGFDTRDWVVYGMTLRRTPEICWQRLQRRFYDKPKEEAGAKSVEQVKTKSGKFKVVIKKEKKSRWIKPPTIDDVHRTFAKWLFLRNNEVIDVMLATVLTQRMDGSPVWMFIVGPPGSAKTAVVFALFGLESKCSFVSSLTAASLVSGSPGINGIDPSLVPKLDGKVMVVKDFTAILGLPDREQTEIFSILRDAYDGNCTKIFGNGIVRNFKSRFSILAASTPKIYDLAETHQALGERFLKFSAGDNLHHTSEHEMIKRAIENSDRESAMREEIQDVTHNFLLRTRRDTAVPDLPDEIMRKIIALSKFGARMRGTVSRDRFHDNMMMSRPMAEVGTRLGQQLAKLARGMAMVYGKPKVTQEEYVLVKKVMIDTISQRNEDVLRQMILAMGGTKVLTPMSMREVASKTHYPYATVQRLMQDLASLQIIKKQGVGALTTWTLSDYVHREVIEAELYDDLKPSTTVHKITLRKKKKHPRKIRIVLGAVKVQPTGDGKFVITNSTTTPAATPHTTRLQKSTA